MLNWLKKRSPAHTMTKTCKAGCLVLILLALAPAPAMAQDSCNPDLNFNISTPGPYFLGDTLRISANLGARNIVGGTYQDIYAFGYALNCRPGQNFQNCTSEGNVVEFQGGLETDCMNSNGEPAELDFPETNVIPITAVEYPIRTGPNQQCTVEFNMRVLELDPSENGDNLVVQAMGWPLEGEPATRCSNGLTSVASSTISFRVQECAIDLKKQVSVDGETWFDADSAQAAPALVLGGTAYYRLIVSNTGTADFVQPITVEDANLGIDVTVPALEAGDSVVLTGGDIAALTASGRCQVLGNLQNTANVGAFCRTGDSPVSASDQDSAFLVCTGLGSVDIEKATNGEDADTPSGPVVAVGSTVTWTYVVTNNGQLPLSNVSVSDSDIGAISCPKSALAVGESMTCTATGTAVVGQYSNTGTVNADSSGGPVSDSDPSHYLGSTPGIDIRKEIWNGASFIDANSADTAPVAHWPAGATYRIVVKNTGAETLLNVVVNDATLGIVNYAPAGAGGAGVLAPGEQVIIGSGQVPALAPESVCEESGDYPNTATTNGESALTAAGVSDSDAAWLRCVGTPALTVKKEISIDGGSTWVDGTAGPVQWPSGALYRITVKNTGSVKLVDVTVSDTLIGPPDHIIGELEIDEEVLVTDGEWAALDVAEVCDSSALVTNIATAKGTSDELASDQVSETDNAALDCIGQPMIAVKKEVSLDDGSTWHDANEEPFPTAVTDPLNPVTALYRITVSNVGNVPLESVVVNDATLGIVDYVPEGVGGPGLLAVGESVEIDSGDLGLLSVQDRCATVGEKANVAGAEGYSEAGVKDEATDSATVDCIGQPAIRITKEVSADGVNFEDVSVSAIVPSDAWYRITVENIGTVDLENVTISDAILGLTDVVVTGAAGAGLLAIGEVVVISHSGGGGDNELAELYVPGLCFEADSYFNTAIADGKSAESVQTVDDADSATFICEARVDICEIGRPNRLKMMYDGDDDSSNEQGDAFVANPESVTFPATPITIKTFNSTNMATPLDVFENMSVGDLFYVEDPEKSGKIPPNIVIEFWDGDTLLQTISFHGSCSAPLNIGDEYSAATIVGVTYL